MSNRSTQDLGQPQSAANYSGSLRAQSIAVYAAVGQTWMGDMAHPDLTVGPATITV